MRNNLDTIITSVKAFTQEEKEELAYYLTFLYRGDSAKLLSNLGVGENFEKELDMKYGPFFESKAFLYSAVEHIDFKVRKEYLSNYLRNNATDGF